jgi:SAM-dependent methyltransferase
MKLDRDRIQAILSKEHGYYRSGDIPIREDERWNLGFYTDFMMRHLTPEARVLDVGCGQGHILMEMCSSFAWGLGIDTDPEFLQMAEEAKRAKGIHNLDFMLLDFPREVDRLDAASFDMVMSIRGPVPDTAEAAQAAHRLLRPDGLLFCTEIAELHHIEEVVTFHNGSPNPTRRVDEVRALLEQNGFEVRLAADIITKVYFPDMYAWLEYTCNIWSWLNVSFPTADDPRFSLFAERNSTPTGEIKTTNHTCWVAGVKV